MGYLPFSRRKSDGMWNTRHSDRKPECHPVAAGNCRNPVGGNSFVINSSTTICYEEGNEKLAGTARMLAGYIKEVTGTEVKIGTKAGKNCIILKVDPSITHKEGYELNVSVDVITLTGATEAGVFYGCQTIHKALP